MSSRLQSLAADSVRSFANTAGSEALVAQLRSAPPPLMPAVAASLRTKLALSVRARDTMARLAASASHKHAAVQAALVTQRPADLGAAAWLALAGRGEPSMLETLLTPLTAMATMACTKADTFGVLSGGEMLLYSGSDPNLAAAGRAALEQARSRSCA